MVKSELLEEARKRYLFDSLFHYRVNIVMDEIRKEYDEPRLNSMSENAYILGAAIALHMQDKMRGEFK